MTNVNGFSTSRPSSAVRARLWIPCLIVFFSGVCIMTIELVASRLVSGHIGMSLYIWTSVIGVILAGISIGNSLGGRLADRFESKRLVAVLFALAGALCLAIIPTVAWVGAATSDWLSIETTIAGVLSPWSARVITVVFVSFFLPGTAIGMITPAIAKWALDCGYASGSTVGTVYAWNNIGSILGTFLAGFYLLDRFELHMVVWISSGMLLLAAAGFIPAIIRGRARSVLASSHSAMRSLEGDDDDAGAGLWIPGLIVFTTGFCIMMLEIVISRLVAGHIGQSLYTWTSVIGVVLAGISLGNYLGGQLADRFDSKRLIGVLFLLSSPLCLTILTTHHMVSNATASWLDIDLKSVVPLALEDWAPSNWAIRVISVIFAAFFLPPMVLGTVSPVVAKWALDRGYASGRTVGTIYAWNTAGSIAGTFAAGFFLISTLYVSRLVSISALILALIAMTLVAGSGWLSRIASGFWLAACTLFVLFAFMPIESFEETVLRVMPVEIEKLQPNELQELRDDLTAARASLDEGDASHQAILEAVDRLHGDLDAKVQSADASNDKLAVDDLGIGARLRQIESDLRSVESRRPANADTNSIAASRRLRRTYNQLFGSRERDRLKMVAAILGRDEEVNIYDQYHFRDDFEYYDESNYYTIQVGEDTVVSARQNDYELDDAGKPIIGDNGQPRKRERTVRTLILDALVHGYIDMSDYTYLHYEYEHIYASLSHRLLRRHQKENQSLKVLFLGGGSYTFPRYLTEYYPGIHCDVAEIDTHVTQTARRALGMNPLRRKRIYTLANDDESMTRADAVGLIARIAALWSAFRTAPSPDRPTHAFYSRRIEQAGAEEVTRLTKSVDFVLDLGHASPALDAARERAGHLNVPIISTETFESMLDTSSHANVVTHHMDARQYILRQSRFTATNGGFEKYDIVYGDAFNDFSVPAHLTTREFNEQMASLLKDDGIFMANVIDLWKVSRFMGAYLNTLGEVFKHVYLFATDEEPGESRSTFVIICSQQPVDLVDLGKRDEDIKGLVGVLMQGSMLAPVTRGGLWPIGTARFAADGERKSFPLPQAVREVAVTVTRTPTDSEYHLERRDKVVFAEPPQKGTMVVVTRLENTRIGSSVFPCDGVQASFALSRDFHRADVEIVTGKGERKLSSGEYKIDGRSLTLPQPPGKDVLVRVTYFNDRLTAIGKPEKFKANGENGNFELSRDCDAVRVKLDHDLSESDYSVTDEGRTLALARAPAAGSNVKVRLYSNRAIVLTDNYCPVDNMLADVAATRAD